MRAEAIKKFDADGDGKLNEEERAKAREAFRKRQGDRQPGGPRGADFRKKLLEKFDADGDGKLSEEERAKAREAFKAKRAKEGNQKPGEKKRRGNKEEV